MRADDTHHVIGFTNEDTLSGLDFKILGLSDRVMRNMALLNQMYGPLRNAIRSGFLEEEEIEVLFLFDVMNPEARANTEDGLATSITKSSSSTIRRSDFASSMESIFRQCWPRSPAPNCRLKNYSELLCGFGM